MRENVKKQKEQLLLIGKMEVNILEKLNGKPHGLRKIYYLTEMSMLQMDNEARHGLVSFPQNGFVLQVNLKRICRWGRFLCWTDGTRFPERVQGVQHEKHIRDKKRTSLFCIMYPEPN